MNFKNLFPYSSGGIVETVFPITVVLRELITEELVLGI